MKLIVAIVKPFKFDEVQEALKAVGVRGMTVLEAQGFGRQRGHTEIYRGAEYEISLVPKRMIQILVDDEDEERCVQAILSSARTDKIGDGKVWVMPVESVIRIRTGESGSDAV